jgi:hypothetical protein
MHPNITSNDYLFFIFQYSPSDMLLYSKAQLSLGQMQTKNWVSGLRVANICQKIREPAIDQI